MPPFHCKFSGRAVGALFAAALFASIATAADPSWYGDIQYLTWDVRADEAEAARAANSEGEILSPAVRGNARLRLVRVVRLQRV